MSEKDKLNLPALNEQVQHSSLRKLFTFGTRGAQGLGAGLATSGLIFTLLALGGITAAVVFEIIAAAAAATTLSVIAMVLAGYQLWKEQKLLTALKEEFDKKLIELKKVVIDLIKNYQMLIEVQESVAAELSRLQNLVDHIDDGDEQKKIQPKITELQKDTKDIEQAKEELISRLKISLNIVAGNNNVDRLMHLFGGVNETAINNYAQTIYESTADQQRVKNGLESLITIINQPLENNSKINSLQSDFNNSIKGKSEKTHVGIKAATYTMASFAGFFGGVGATIAIGALIFGGMSALLAVGWPVIAVAAGVGLVTMVGSLIYYAHVERAQRKATNNVHLANAQVSGIKNYLEEDVNKITHSKLTALDDKYKKASNEIAIRLDEHEKTFNDYKVLTQDYTKKAKSFLEEIKVFKKFPSDTLKKLDDFKKDINRDIILLEGLKARIKKVAVVAGSEEKKTTLLHNIDEFLVEAKNDLEMVTPIYNQVEINLHQPVINQGKITDLAESSAQKEEDVEDESEGEGLER